MTLPISFAVVPEEIKDRKQQIQAHRGIAGRYLRNPRLTGAPAAHGVPAVLLEADDHTRAGQQVEVVPQVDVLPASWS